MKPNGIKILSIQPNSPAHLAGFSPGDLLLKVDEFPLEDALDLHYHLDEGEFRLEVKRNGSVIHIPLVKALGENPGWELEPMRTRTCRCNCVFCFVRQLPEGLRPSLYVKDEDYRFSFLFGNYLTLFGLKPRDLDRILRLRLSPLYVSIHATDPVVRGNLLGVKQAPILPVLQKLLRGGIEIHGQVVLVPGLNDGAVLNSTLRDLFPLRAGLKSLSIVPVGLTAHRSSLTAILPLDRGDALTALELIESFQTASLQAGGNRWVYPADELLLLAGAAIPADEYYDDYPQIENGVGLVRRTICDAEKWLRSAPASLAAQRRILWVTGTSAHPILTSLAAKITRKIRNLQISVIAARNGLLGESVSVAGLLSGGDILIAVRQQLSPEELSRVHHIFLPPDCLNADGLLLDDLTEAHLSGRLGVPVTAFNRQWGRMIEAESAGRMR
jgi:putative radical SAM enzyme (TIGR03279 family)